MNKYIYLTNEICQITGMMITSTLRLIEIFIWREICVIIKSRRVKSTVQIL